MIKNNNIPYISVEVNEIFKFMSDEMLSKIPKNVKDFFKTNVANNYSFTYDQSKKLKDQNIRKDTKEMLAIIYKEYICNDIERKDFINARQIIEIKKEEEKRKKYNPDNLFSPKIKENEIQEITISENKDNFIKKCIIFIKKIFSKI